MKPFVNPWDESAAAYGKFIARREQADLEMDPILSRMLALLGDLDGREVLDDVADHRGFATTLASLARAGGRVVLAFDKA